MSGLGNQPKTNFTSWNVRGANHPVKCNKIFLHLKKLKTKVAYLQETHLKNCDHAKLRRGGFQQIFHSSFNTKSRGTAILIHRNIQFTKSKVISDRDGRFVIVQGKLYNVPVILANVYAPNWDNVEFFKDFFLLDYQK